MWFSLSDGRYHGDASVELFALGRAESKLRIAEGERLRRSHCRPRVGKR